MPFCFLKQPSSDRGTRPVAAEERGAPGTRGGSGAGERTRDEQSSQKRVAEVQDSVVKSVRGDRVLSYRNTIDRNQAEPQDCVSTTRFRYRSGDIQTEARVSTVRRLPGPVPLPCRHCRRRRCCQRSTRTAPRSSRRSGASRPPPGKLPE